MKYKLALIMCGGLLLASFGCKSTSNQATETQPMAQPAASAPVANQPAAAQIASKRVYDASYLPTALRAKVDTQGSSYINKPFAVRELVIDGKIVYEVTNEGTASYYDLHGTELAGADKERISAQAKTASATR